MFLPKCHYLFGDLTGHLLCEVSVLTYSVEQLTTLHHLHDDQQPCSDQEMNTHIMCI